jgi:hypothetical protein
MTHSQGLLALLAALALGGAVTLTAVPAAAQYNDYGGGYEGGGGYEPSYRPRSRRRYQEHCYFKRVRVYDEYRGYYVYRRVRVCD